MEKISNTEYQRLRNEIWNDLVSAGVTSDEDENYRAFDEVLGSNLEVDWNWDEEDRKRTSRKDMIKYLKSLVLDEHGSDKCQLDNLDWAKLVSEDGNILVENEHSTRFDIEDLSDQELEIFWINN